MFILLLADNMSKCNKNKFKTMSQINHSLAYSYLNCIKMTETYLPFIVYFQNFIYWDTGLFFGT